MFDSIRTTLAVHAANFPDASIIRLECPDGFDVESALTAIGVVDADGVAATLQLRGNPHYATWLWLLRGDMLRPGVDKARLESYAMAFQSAVSRVDSRGIHAVVDSLLADAVTIPWSFGGGIGATAMPDAVEHSDELNAAIQVLAQVRRTGDEYEQDESRGTIAIVSDVFDKLAAMVERAGETVAATNGDGATASEYMANRPYPDWLNKCQREALQAVDESENPMHGEQLAERTGYKYNSRFKTDMAAMTRGPEALLESTAAGYRRPYVT